MEQTPEDWKSLYQLGVCYSGRCQKHALVSPELALKNLGSACKRLPHVEEHLRARILSLLGLMYRDCTALPPRTRLLCALKCQEKAAELCFRSGAMQEWARGQYNLGNTWCELPVNDFPAKWENAIAHYELALRFRNEANDPPSFAATLENLGTAYRQLSTGDKAANVYQAIRCYRRALRLCRVTSNPAQWAALHNNLGNACLSLPYRDARARAAHGRHALHHFDRALSFRTLERSPYDCALTTFNRGQACLELARCEAVSWLADAMRCFRKAQAVYLHTGAVNEAALVEKVAESICQALGEYGPEWNTEAASANRSTTDCMSPGPLPDRTSFPE